jgi:hypothetical protein
MGFAWGSFDVSEQITIWTWSRIVSDFRPAKTRTVAPISFLYQHKSEAPMSS